MPLISISNCEEEYGRSIQLPKCNVERCTEKFAPCFNKVMKTYYCIKCARDINYAPLPDGTYLCEIPERSKLADMELLCYEDKQYVGTRKLEDVPELWGEAQKRMPDAKMSTGFAAFDKLAPKGGFKRGDLLIFSAKSGRAIRK
jgi:hypothetical protein